MRPLLLVLALLIATPAIAQDTLDVTDMTVLTTEPVGDLILMWDLLPDTLAWYPFDSLEAHLDINGGHVLYDEETGASITDRDTMSFSSDFTLSDQAGDGVLPGRSLVSITSIVNSLGGATGDLTSATLDSLTAQSIQGVAHEETVAGAVTPDLSNSWIFYYDLTGDITLSNPINPPSEAGKFLYVFTQDATGGHEITSCSSKWYYCPEVNTGSLEVTYAECIYNPTADTHVCPYVLDASERPTIIEYALSDASTALTTGTGVVEARAQFPYTLLKAVIAVPDDGAPAGSAIIVDMNESGTSIFSTRTQIDAGDVSSESSATQQVISDSSIAEGAEVSFDIDQVGSTTAGHGLKIYLHVIRE